MELDSHALPGASSASRTGISQGINTVASDVYELRFAFAGRPETSLTDNILKVELSTFANFDDTQIAFTLIDESTGLAVANNQPQLVGGTGWHYYKTRFVAGAFTNLRFSDLGAVNSLGSFLDDVSLTRVAAQPTIDIAIDGVGESLEDNALEAAFIRLNNDFSKNNFSTEAPLPDYDAAGTPQFPFDPNFRTDLTRATVSIAEGFSQYLDIVLSFGSNVAVWDATNWLDEELPYPPPTKIVSGQAFSPGASQLKLWIEGLDSSATIGGDALTVDLVQRSSPGIAVATDSAKYTVIDINAAVDGNRDGAIDFSNRGDRSLLFWYNNDREGSYSGDALVETDASIEDVPSLTPDFSDGTIQLRRDLEDFAALSLFVDPLLSDQSDLNIEYYVTIEEHASLPELWVYRTFDNVDNAMQHITNAEYAAAQVSSSLKFGEIHVESHLQDSTNTLDSEFVDAGHNPYIFEVGSDLDVR